MLLLLIHQLVEIRRIIIILERRSEVVGDANNGLVEFVAHLMRVRRARDSLSVAARRIQDATLNLVLGRADSTLSEKEIADVWLLLVSARRVANQHSLSNALGRPKRQAHSSCRRFELRPLSGVPTFGRRTPNSRLELLVGGVGSEDVLNGETIVELRHQGLQVRTPFWWGFVGLTLLSDCRSLAPIVVGNGLAIHSGSAFISRVAAR